MSKTDTRRPAGSGTVEPIPPHHGAPHCERSSAEHRLNGIAVGSGIAIGPAYLFEDHTPDLPPRMVAEDETAGEVAGWTMRSADRAASSASFALSLRCCPMRAGRSWSR
jgi:hypothetical protein